MQKPSVSWPNWVPASLYLMSQSSWPHQTKTKMFTDDKDQKEISPWAQELQDTEGMLVRNKKATQITSKIWGNITMLVPKQCQHLLKWELSSIWGNMKDDFETGNGFWRWIELGQEGVDLWVVERSLYFRERERENWAKYKCEDVHKSRKQSRKKSTLDCNTLSFRTHSRVANDTHYFNRRKTM